MLIRLTGPVTLAGAATEHRISASKQACVLAVLAERPGAPVSRSDLVHRVWDSDPPESALAGLYSYVTKLRALFRDSPQVSISRAGAHGYVLDADPLLVDVHAVRDRIGRARASRRAGDLPGAVEHWRAACELVRGEALVGIGGAWARRFRSGFRDEHVNLLTERFAAELELGNHAAIVDELTAVTVGRPMAEPLAAQLMLALYRCGRAADALAGFDALRTRLRDRLGADPAPELRDLHVRILRQDPDLDLPRSAAASAPPEPVPSRPVPAQLPADNPGLVGRDAEIAAGVTRARPGGVLVIDGMAGVGKTALALRIGHRLAPEYPDGQLYVDLRGYADGVPPLEPGQVLARLLRSLDAEIPDDADERAAALRTALAGRRVLLVLDNAHDAAQVAPLLPGDGGCLTLVTSRRRLVELVDAQPLSLRTLDAAPATRLFAAEAGTAADPGVVAEIAAACGGLPLAVRLAASRLRNRPSWTAADLLRRLTDDRSAIGELDFAGRGVAAAFELSYQELDSATAELFRLLSLFPGADFDRYTAACVADTEPDVAEALLEQLVDVHLLMDSGPGRYRFHDLLRQFAVRQLTEPEPARTRLRLADGYVWAARQAIQLVDPSFRTTTQPVDPANRRIPHPVDARQAESWFDSELPVLQLVFDAAEAQGLDAHVVELCLHIQTYFMHHFNPGLGLPIAERGLAAAERLGDRELKARTANHVGLRLTDQARYPEALAVLRRNVELFHQIGDVRGESIALNNVGRCHMFIGDHDEAVEIYTRAAELGEAAHNPAAVALARSNMSEALAILNRTAEALANLDQADELLRDRGNVREQVRATWMRATVLQHAGDHDTALGLLRRVETYCREHDNMEGLSSALTGMIRVHLHQDRPAEALELAQEQLNLLAGLGHQFQETITLHQIGAAQAALNRADEAVDSLRAATAQARAIGSTALLARCDHTLGALLHDLGQTTEARALLTRALDFYSVGDHTEADELRRLLARTHD